MGDRRRRKLQFLTDHPVCCFCGGSASAVTEDHVPARAIFDGRQWPEGYSFPACNSCNQITRRDENVLAFLTRLNPGEMNELRRKETRRCMAAMHHSHPEAFRSLMPSSNSVRRFLKERGLARPPNVSLRDIPLINFGQPEFIRPIKNFSIKLFCALHYKHTGKIVLPIAKIAIRFLTNVQTGTEDVLNREVFKVLRGRPRIIRAQNDLQDQFSYVYAVADNEMTSAYICKFRESFVWLGIVSSTGLPADFDEDMERGSFLGTAFE